MSITQHPAPDPLAQYSASFHGDRVCLDAEWPDLRTRCTVWVSPEDDCELRTVELVNPGSGPLELVARVNLGSRIASRILWQQAHFLS